MKYALVNNERLEAQQGLLGECPGCRRPMVARCGEIKVNHRAHRGIRVCDPWWENETEWHRAWKGHFLPEWQEQVHEAADGEKHIADVKTNRGWVLEFQHSAITPEERRSRNDFYKKLVWVVNGLRRKRDHQQFLQTLTPIGSINGNAIIGRVCTARFPENSELIRDWAGSHTPIFFDFSEEAVLWCLLSTDIGENKYVIEFSRKHFIGLHKNGPPDKDFFQELMSHLKQIASEHSVQLQAQSQRQTIRQPQPVRAPYPFEVAHRQRFRF